MLRERHGFTLIEMMVALTIGALVLLLAHQVFVAVAGDSRALMAARRRLDRAANAHRWLAATFLSLEVGTDSAAAFDGQPDRLDFVAWERTADDWFERRHIRLGRRGYLLVAAVTPGAPVALIDSVRDVAFDYLLEPGAESRWVREWISSVSAPIAVRLRVSCRRRGKGEEGRVVTDTMLFLIKERG
jgi:prepilin-type N-terminal cleavage/methylation domain-containing protein